MSSADEAILDQINAIMTEVKTGLRAGLLAEGLDLVAMEAHALRVVQRHPGCSQTEFARALGRDKAQVARIVKPLVERGLLAVLPDQADRRVNRLWLTQEGQAAHQRAARHRARLAAAMMRGLDSRERTRVEALLARMAANLAEARAAGAAEMVDNINDRA